MSGNTVVITGATGQLGRQCLKTFSAAKWTVVGTGLSRAKPPTIRKVDLRNAEEIVELLDDVKPQVVVHCAAERFPDKCDADPEGANKLNVQATETLAQECSSRDIFLIYLSTDYVFGGRAGEAPYETDMATNPPNFYGATKLAGEKAVLKAGEKSVVLRVPVLYGEVEQNKESALNVLLDAVWNVEKKERIEMDDWSIRYPTNTSDVARVLKDIAEKYTSSSDSPKLPRILQFSSEDRLTKYKICQILADIAGLPIDHIAPNSEHDPNASLVRPYDCHLSTQALRDIGVSVETVPFKHWWQRRLRAFKH